MNIDIVAQDLFDKIRGTFPNITIGDEMGSVVNEPTKARFFEFSYNPVTNDKVSISLSSKDGVSVMYSKNIVASDIQEDKDKWYNFLRELRQFARKRLLNFDTRDITKSNLNKRDYQYLAKASGEDTMTESKLYGTSRLSYQDVDGARLVIKHNKPVNQDLAAGRTQNISSIYIESSEGERFKYPYKHLTGARAMARHVAEGGNAYDDFGKHIVGLSEELSKLRKFKNYMSRSSVMAEGLADYLPTVNERIESVKKTIENLQKKSYYDTFKETYQAPVLEDVPLEVAENWIDQLTIRQFNEELKDIFPYIYNLVSEASLAEEIGPEELLGEERDDERIAKKLMQKGYDSDNSDEEIKDAMIELGYGKYMTRDRDLYPEVLDRLADMTHGDDDGQPSSYDEYQDLYGGDDYDFGQYEQAIESGIDKLMGQFAEDEESDNAKKIKAWFDKWSKYEAGNGNDMAEGYLRYALDSGIATDFYNADEYMAVEKEMGMDSDDRDAELEMEPRELLDKMPLTKQCMQEINKITGTNDIEKNAEMINDVVELFVDPNPKIGEEGEQKEQKAPLGEFILSYYDRETGEFPKGETAVLTMVEKDYGEQFIDPAKAFIESIYQVVEKVNNSSVEPMDDTDMQEDIKLNDADKAVMQKLTGMIKQKQKEMQDARKGGYDEDVRMIANQLEDFYSIAELIQGKRPMGLDTAVMDLVHDMYDEVGGKFDEGNEELDRIKGLAGL